MFGKSSSGEPTMRLSLLWATIGGCLVWASLKVEAGQPDYGAVDRTIRKQPSYTSTKPLYGLALFGERGEKRVWFVLDKSDAQGEQYDVLYLDRNADGDLTGPGKRFTLKEGKFDLGNFTDPATGAKHTAFQLRVDKGDNPDVMISLRWKGDLKFGGGYPENPETGYMKLATKPADAPVIWVNADPPFRFQRWYGRELEIDGSSDLKVFLGQPGSGRSTFFGAQTHFLPDAEVVKATLIFRDRDGKEQRSVCELKERC
jgi:hypothetical protein